MKSSQMPHGRPREWWLFYLPDVSLAHPSHSPRTSLNTWEPHVSFGGGSAAPPPPRGPERNAQTLAMGHRITHDPALYEAALRLLFGVEAEGLDPACVLGMRLHAWAQAERLNCAGVDFVEIAGDLLDE